MNDLERYFLNNTGNLIHKWMHYFDIYDRHFARYRGTDVHVLEIGVFHGGSLQMWRDYFGPRSRIIGVDVEPECRRFAGDGIEIQIGDQEDRRFLGELVERFPRVDIVIDDGGHEMRQQINSLEVLYPHVAPDGLYVCEDLHTSYWKSHGGGYRRRSTFIEHSKNLIDYLHAWHSKDLDREEAWRYARSTYGLHYYDSVLVIEKKPIEPPEHRQVGKPSRTDI